MQTFLVLSQKRVSKNIGVEKKTNISDASRLLEKKLKKLPVKVFRYSFSEAIPIFFNRLKSVFSSSDRYKFSPVILVIGYEVKSILLWLQ